MPPWLLLTEPLNVDLPGTVPASCNCSTSPLGVWNNSISPPFFSWSVTTFCKLSVYASRFPAANVTKSGVPTIPFDPMSRLFDKSVNPLFKSVLVCPSTVIRQNVLSESGTLGVSVTLCEDAE